MLLLDKVWVEALVKDVDGELQVIDTVINTY